jgi:hypothetical protein
MTMSVKKKKSRAPQLSEKFEKAFDQLDEYLKTLPGDAQYLALGKTIRDVLYYQATVQAEDLKNLEEKFDELTDTNTDLEEQMTTLRESEQAKELLNPSNWNGNTWRPALATDSNILDYLDKVFQ